MKKTILVKKTTKEEAATLSKPNTESLQQPEELEGQIKQKTSAHKTHYPVSAHRREINHL